MKTKKKGEKEGKEKQSEGGSKGIKKEGGGWVQGIRGAWVLRRV